MQVQTLLRWGALLAAVTFPVPVVAQEGGSLPVDLELVLAVDISGSIDETEARLQREGYIRALAHPEIIQAIQSGVYGRQLLTQFPRSASRSCTTWRRACTTPPSS